MWIYHSTLTKGTKLNSLSVKKRFDIHRLKNEDKTNYINIQEGKVAQENSNKKMTENLNIKILTFLDKEKQ